MANRNWSNGKKISIMHVDPALIDCSFTVASSNTNGLGITGLSGSMVQNVFMHTSQTAGTGNSNQSTPNIAIKNPNPTAGYIIVQLQDPYNTVLGAFMEIQSPLSGSSISISGTSVMTIGSPYVITALGTTTTAQWQAVGVPTGVIPTVGMTFIAKVTGGGTGTGTVQAPAAAGSGIFSLELVGDPNQMINNSPLNGSGTGAQMVFATRNASGASAAAAIAALTDGSIVRIGLYLSNSKTNVGSTIASGD